MPANLLKICRDHLERIYQAKIGTAFSSSIADIGKSRQPVWRFVCTSDLTTETEAPSSGAAGLLLDPEIGLLFYLVPFDLQMNMRNQIVRGLALRSQLSTERNYTGEVTADSDTRGAWRVVVTWLVEAGAKDKWIEQVMTVRRETAFSEEVSLDALFLDGDDIEAQLSEHGFPRLLLTVREVFKKPRLDEMVRWMSANHLVAHALETFAANFRKPEQRQLADEVVRAMRDFCARPRDDGKAGPPPETPMTLRSIRVRDFRNLRDVSLDFGLQPVSARIVHGPNGTGKSSLCEALSVALFQSSFRYKMFADGAREKDVAARDRGNDYFKNYLTPLEDENAEPKLAIDGDTFVRPQLVSVEKVEEADLAMSGTILTQDMSLEFARMPSHELGARVLRGYSELAEHVEEFTESRVTQANTERQTFLRQFGLSAAITKVGTAYERIAKREIDQSLPAFPYALITWLEQVIRFRLERGTDLPQRWRAWGEDESRNEVAKAITSPNNDLERVQHELREWLEIFNELTLQTAEFARMIETRIAPILQEFDTVTARISAWGQWLEGRQQALETGRSAEVAALAKKLQETQAKQQQVLERGRSAGGHFDHLAQVEAYVRENWSRSHPNECPTCGTNHAQHGGIISVIGSLHAQTRAERDQLRDEYSSLKLQVAQTQKRLAELGQAQCPITAEEQANLAGAFQWLVPNNEDFPQWIAVRTQREELLTTITMLRQMPTLPTRVDAETQAERVANVILSQFRTAEITFERPANWKPVKDKLTKTLADIVNEHLPNTLQKLWCELTLSLTSAPWLLPERPCIDVETRRGEQRSTIQVKGRLARYILNQSEIHILGLAWFFTRYLTYSRFFHASLVMDDPAHELDQTSFRDLCRLWETLVRLHRVYDRPLTLVVMLNQESRAVEAARATGGILGVLGWSREQEESVRATSVIGGGFFALQPGRLFEKTGS